KRFFTSNLRRVGNWTPNCGATQNRGDVALNTRDAGRRALSTFIRRSREHNADQAMAFSAPMALTKWKELADIRPFDEMQFDGHYIDLRKV
ncbi:hypothetical protein, partial [Xanthomonas codiaei]|uniref:hypothetical protein n=1 Tax=Xanthomonas codiaei TaxID=56463 RepID=UPI001ABF60BA